MKSYKVYESENKVSTKGHAYKKLVLQEPGAQYPLKGVTMFANHPLFEEIAPGQTVELDIETKDSDTPNPHGGFYKNRTVLNPVQSPKADIPAPTKQPAEDISAKVMNMLTLKIEPMLQAIHRELVVIAGRQERQMGLAKEPIDYPKDDINPDDIPF